MSAPAGALDLMGAFIAVREAPEGEREAMITRCAAGDLSFERDLRTLLDDASRAERATLCAGARLQGGRYHLLRELGRGGSAAVWLARDAKLEREIALKVLEGQAGEARFGDALREARAASPIVDEHVCRVLDVDLCPDRAAAYIAMETCREREQDHWLDARTLRDTPARSRREAIRWAAQVARGLQAAHQQGVFHGDLKPDNVVIRPVTRRAQVIDFGLARHFVAGHSPFAPPHESLRVVGTPAYMAPEQALGLPADLDPDIPEDHERLCRIDIYAAGALLYELLSGRPPYTARSDAADAQLAGQGADRDIMQQVVEHAPAPLRGSLGLLTGQRWPAPARLRRIVRTAMHRDPQLRHSSCAALAADLEAYLEGRPTSLDGPHARGVLWLRRNVRGVLLFLSALICVGLLLHTRWLDDQIGLTRKGHALSEARDAAQAARAAQSQTADQRDRLASRQQRLQQEVDEEARLRRAAVERLRARQAEATRLRVQLQLAQEKGQAPAEKPTVEATKQGSAADQTARAAVPAGARSQQAPPPVPARDRPASRKPERRAQSSSAETLRTGPSVAYAHLRRALLDTPIDEPLTELRGARGALMGLWGRKLPGRGGLLVLDAAQRRDLELILRRRALRDKWHRDAGGRLEERCVIVRPSTGSRLQRRTCSPLPDPPPHVPWLRLAR